MNKSINNDLKQSSHQLDSKRDVKILSKTAQFNKGFKEVIFGDADSYLNLGISYAQAGNYVKALKNFREALKINPNE